MTMNKTALKNVFVSFVYSVFCILIWLLGILLFIFGVVYRPILMCFVVAAATLGFGGYISYLHEVRELEERSKNV